MEPLTREERYHFALLGYPFVTIVAVRDGARLLQGETLDRWLVRGWYHQNDGPPDVRWVKETMLGWPDSVCVS